VRTAIVIFDFAFTNILEQRNGHHHLQLHLHRQFGAARSLSTCSTLTSPSIGVRDLHLRHMWHQHAYVVYFKHGKEFLTSTNQVGLTRSALDKQSAWRWKPCLAPMSESLKMCRIIYNYLTYIDYYAYFDYINVFWEGSMKGPKWLEGSE
jgi:hypothetical protein